MSVELYTIDISKSRTNQKTHTSFLSRDRAVTSIQNEIFSYLKNYNGQYPVEFMEILDKCHILKDVSKLSDSEIHRLFLYLEKILGLEVISDEVSEHVNKLIHLKRGNRQQPICLVSPEEKLLEIKMKYLKLKPYVWTELYNTRRNLAIALGENLGMLKYLKQEESKYLFSLSDEKILGFFSFLKKNNLCLSQKRLSEFSL